jgi:hypothetical protein
MGRLSSSVGHTAPIAARHQRPSAITERILPTAIDETVACRGRTLANVDRVISRKRNKSMLT